MALTSLSEPCTGRRASGLVCAYTGRPLTVMVSSSPRTGWRWFAVPLDPPSPAARGTYYRTVADLMVAVGTRNGVPGCLTGEAALVCPYTGARLSIAHSARGFYAEGGWSPFTPCTSLFRLEHFTRMRDGVPAPGTVPEPPTVHTSSREPPETLEKPRPSGKAMALADELTDRFLSESGKRVTVGPSPTHSPVPSPTPSPRRRKNT